MKNKPHKLLLILATLTPLNCFTTTEITLVPGVRRVPIIIAQGQAHNPQTTSNVPSAIDAETNAAERAKARKPKPKIPPLAQMGFSGGAASISAACDQQEEENQEESFQVGEEPNRVMPPAMGFSGGAASISTDPALPEEQESWKDAALDAIGNIIVPWQPSTLPSDEVFELLKNDPKNQSELPRNIWVHILNCIQFQNSFITRTGEICLPNLKNKLLSKEEARIALLALQQGDYDLKRWVPESVLEFMGDLS